MRVVFCIIEPNAVNQWENFLTVPCVTVHLPRSTIGLGDPCDNNFHFDNEDTSAVFRRLPFSTRSMRRPNHSGGSSCHRSMEVLEGL